MYGAALQDEGEPNLLEDAEKEIARLREEVREVPKLKRDLEQAREEVRTLTKLNRDLQQVLCEKMFHHGKQAISGLFVFMHAVIFTDLLTWLVLASK